MDAEVLKEIKRVYYTPATGFQGAKKLYQKMKKDYSEVTLKQVQDWLSLQKVQQVFSKRPVKKDDFNQILTNAIGSFQMDLMDLSNYKSKNRGFRYLLILVDIYSRYSLVFPLKNKKSQTVLHAFRKVLEQYPGPLTNIQSDQRNEFNGIRQEYPDVNFFTKPPGIHKGLTAIVDRRIRFIRDILEKYFKSYATLKWTDIISDINENINKTINKTIKQRPVDVFLGNAKQNQDIRVPPEQLHPGQKVRILLNKKTFEKGSLPKYSTELHTIDSIDGLGYRLNDKRRKFQYWELKLINGDVESRDSLDSLDLESVEKQKKQSRIANKVGVVLNRLK